MHRSSATLRLSGARALLAEGGTFNEADHPREPKGTSKGGQFAPKGGNPYLRPGEEIVPSGLGRSAGGARWWMIERDGARVALVMVNKEGRGAGQSRVIDPVTHDPLGSPEDAIRYARAVREHEHAEGTGAPPAPPPDLTSSPGWPPASGARVDLWDGERGVNSVYNKDAMVRLAYPDGALAIRKRITVGPEPAVSAAMEVAVARAAALAGNTDVFGRVSVSGDTITSELRDAGPAGTQASPTLGKAAFRPGRAEQPAMDDLRLIAFVDHVMGNADRHGANLMRADDGDGDLRFYAIDHDLMGPNHGPAMWAGRGSGVRMANRVLEHSLRDYGDQVSAWVRRDPNARVPGKAQIVTPPAARRMGREEWMRTVFGGIPDPKDPMWAEDWRRYKSDCYDRYGRAVELGAFTSDEGY